MYPLPSDLWHNASMDKAQSAHSSCISILKDVDPGIQRMAMDARLLYPDRSERHQFEERLREFLKVDTCDKVINYHDGVVSYLTESVVPAKLDLRPPLLLLFGNPAPESVRRGCFLRWREEQARASVLVGAEGVRHNVLR